MLADLYAISLYRAGDGWKAQATWITTIHTFEGEKQDPKICHHVVTTTYPTQELALLKCHELINKEYP